MIVALDVDYRPDATVTAKVAFAAWTDAEPVVESVHRVAGAAAPYEPGRFYLRELPHLLAALGDDRPDAVVIDGYVWLARDRPGLGAHLHEAVRVPVIGVAKEPFRGNDVAVAIARGSSRRPLYVTAIGCDVETAARDVRSMHGAHRIPTLLARVDRRCRAGQSR